MTLRIGILETGRPPEDLLNRHGDYPQLVDEWVAPLGGESRSYAVLDGEFPESASDADLWVITGSRHGVYEDHDWIPPLEQFIRDVRDAGGKMFGICFGHQIIAQALGGKVEKSEKGWGTGVHSYDLADDWPEKLGGPLAEGLAMQVFHQDQVIDKPETAATLASSGFCEYAALWYPDFAVTVQGHPEYTSEFARDLIEARRELVLVGRDPEAAFEETRAPTTREALALWLRDTLNKI